MTQFFRFFFFLLIVNRIRTIVNFRDPNHSSPEQLSTAALGSVMFCPQLSTPWLREYARENSVFFPKAFSGFSFLEPAHKNMILWLFTYLLGLMFYLHVIISRIFHFFLLTKAKVLKKITFLLFFFVWFLWRRWTEVEKVNGSYLRSLHRMEINQRNIQFSHRTTTQCYILVKAFTGKGLFSLSIFFSSSENWKKKNFCRRWGPD